ncbi:MAG: SGNH/GDSL hydrolase family protein [Acidobacteriota bacterium]
MPLPALLVLALLATNARSAEIRVLFVGNSLTAANDLPAMVKELARADGAPLLVESIARPGYSLEDHLAEGTAVGRLRADRWDFVVLQQGPSALPESRVELIRSATKFAGLARAEGATPVLFMVWPSRSRLFDFERVSQSYRQAGVAAHALIAAAGDAWRAAWKKDPSLQFYGPDGFHPSPTGSQLAAQTIYHAIKEAKTAIDRRPR